MRTNFPAGIKDSDIPGNRSKDEEWERVHEWIDELASARRLEPHQVKLAVEMGLAAMEKVAPQLSELAKLSDDLAWGYLKREQPPESQ
jgi:hypothetical protein